MSLVFKVDILYPLFESTSNSDRVCLSGHPELVVHKIPRSQDRVPFELESGNCSMVIHASGPSSYFTNQILSWRTICTPREAAGSYDLTLCITLSPQGHLRLQLMHQTRRGAGKQPDLPVSQRNSTQTISTNVASLLSKRLGTST